ncbi:hypothetical protein ABT336_11865 [Micromonospora sp. NPDC000207]|uniref:hypothetical protein n=1 Tax=Micromonospora sp. NPDC000207 TaxID=3154246 RepID=UPI003319AF77
MGKNAYTSSPHQFEIGYRFRHSGGQGSGCLEVGVDTASLNARQADEIKQQILASLAAGVRHDPATLVVQVTSVNKIR